MKLRGFAAAVFAGAALSAATVTEISPAGIVPGSVVRNRTVPSVMHTVPVSTLTAPVCALDSRKVN